MDKYSLLFQATERLKKAEQILNYAKPNEVKQIDYAIAEITAAHRQIELIVKGESA